MKRGLSPVVATALLIAVAVFIGAVILVGFKNAQQETITKYGDTNIALICDEIEFEAKYSSNILAISNIGGVDIYNFKVRVSNEGGSYDTYNLSSLAPSWPLNGLDKGDAFSSGISIAPDAEQIILIPVLIGDSEEGQKTYLCEERHGRMLDV